MDYHKNLTPQQRKLRLEVVAGLYLGKPIKRLTIYEISQVLRVNKDTVGRLLTQYKNKHEELFNKPLSWKDREGNMPLLDNLRHDSVNPQSVVWDDSTDRLEQQRSLDASQLKQSTDKDSLWTETS